MLYRLLYSLQEFEGAFRVFRFITFRTALAVMTALALSLVLGPWMIRRLRRFQIGQSIRKEGPASHHAKAGTPTMGGVLIVVSILVPTLLWGDLENPMVWVALLSLTSFATIGGLDDYLKLVRGGNMGLRAFQKMGLQLAVALGIGLILFVGAQKGWYSTNLSVPFFKGFTPDLGWGYVLFTTLVLVSAANAVNLTDGLDGLAIGCTAVAYAAYTAITYIVGHAVAAGYLGIIHVGGAAELTVFCGAALGASLGFLWWNAHPAEVFMGDIGSMALGGSVGTVAVLMKQEVLLLVVGGVFVLEALSVILQVGYFKSTGGSRIFRMAPLHHHFELSGWPENKVVVRFWILAILFALLSFSTLKLR